MSSSHPKKTPISKALPCPECGELELTHIVEAYRLLDGLRIKRLPHFKCDSCGARLFDDDAMQTIEATRTRAAQGITNVVGSKRNTQS